MFTPLIEIKIKAATADNNVVAIIIGWMRHQKATEKQTP